MIIGELAGFLASILATVTFLPQVVKTLRSKNTSGLSAMTLTFSFLGNLGWLINGLAYQNAPLIFSGGLIMVLLLPLFYVKHQNKELINFTMIKGFFAGLFIIPQTDP